MTSSSLLTNIARVQDSTERVASHIAGATLVVLMLLVFADVVMRYVFNSPIQGAFDAIEMIVIVIAFLALARVQALRQHIALELLVQYLSRRAKYVLGLLDVSIGVFIFGLITWRGGIFAWDSWLSGEATYGVVNFPLWPAKVIFVIGFGLLWLRFLSQFFGVAVKFFGEDGLGVRK